jgi:acyl carrier protein
MERPEVVSAIEKALAEVLEREVPPLTEEMRFFEDLHLDSTSIMELLISLEDGIGFVVDPETLDMDDFKSVGSFTTFLLAARGQS